MDIISHGLYGGVVFGQKNKKQFWLATAFGVMPDFLAFGVPFLGTITALLSGADIHMFSQMGHHIDANYIHIIYNITHSIIIRGIVFGILWLLYKKPVKAIFARLLHILIDIPTHSLAFFATPFLWPISNYKFDGIPWSNKMIFLPNLLILLILYSIYFYKRSRKHTKG